MNLAALSIKRPAFITCIVVLILVLGYGSMKRLGVDLFPDVTFPIVFVSTPYPGAGPEEIENQVSKIIEEEISSISGVKTVRSVNKESLSQVIVEFNLEVDVKYAEQQVKDRVTAIRRKLPTDVEESIIRRIDPADQPIVIVSISSDKLKPAELFDLADNEMKPSFEQINQVGMVQVIGGRKREIQVQLDRNKLKQYEVSATQVTQRIAATGQNIPAGKVSDAQQETIFRTLGEYKKIDDIGKTVVNFLGNDVAVTVDDLGQVVDTLEDEKSRAFVNGEGGVFLMIFRQSGANTIAVAEAAKKRVDQLIEQYSKTDQGIKLTVVRDLSKYIRANVDDVVESITIGIILTILVVFFFLGSMRSTVITGAALPNSLLGAFILMALAGFTINVMTLLALSLAVGLLIDDAIVVRENIFRHIELGKKPEEAAYIGTREVTLAVVATTLTVIAVFGPIAFLQGVVGQFFKQFGLTICFAMAISLFDALTVAPMLSAYMPSKVDHEKKPKKGLSGLIKKAVTAFDKLQTKLEEKYVTLIKFTLRRPIFVLFISFMIFALSIGAAGFIPKTFLPAQDQGEFGIGLEMPPGTSLEEMTKVAKEVDQVIRSQKEVLNNVMIVGNSDGEANITEFFIELVPIDQRDITTIDFKEKMREALKPYSYAKPKVKDIDIVGGGRPFNLNITGNNQKEIEAIAHQVFEKLKNHPGLKDVDITDKPGKPEFQVALDNKKADLYGVSSTAVGLELRTLVEGQTPAVFRDNGEEYDIRVRLKEEQRDLKEGFPYTYVPNLNYSLVKISSIAKPVETVGVANINRENRGRYIQINADVAPDGPGIGGVITDVHNMFKNEITLPPGVNYRFVGQAENFQELLFNMVIAAGLGILFIYLVLASLYESYITPFTIMLVLPLAACGAFYGLLVTGKSLDLFSMIGCVMLLGIATKNSILLVDRIHQLLDEGHNMVNSIIESGKTRLRPILMTSFALIAGMLPVAIGLNEASRQRTSMGVAIIGGLVSSTLLTLIVIPAAFIYIERVRRFFLKLARKWAGLPPPEFLQSSATQDIRKQLQARISEPRKEEYFEEARSLDEKPSTL